MRKIFTRICKFFGYEIIDQNVFYSPTLNKELNEDLSIINKKSIVLPLGEVKISRKVNSVLIILRMNTEVQIWDQNKKRLFQQPKIEYSVRSLKSLIKSYEFCKNKYSNLRIKLIIIKDRSKNDNLTRIEKIIEGKNIDLITLDHNEFKEKIAEQKTEETFSNLASLYKSFEIGKDIGEDLIYFLEDDYIHFQTMLDEMVSTFERIASQMKKDIFMCPADYPYLYMNEEKTNVLIGSSRHWRTINKSLCSFMTTKNLLDKYWINFQKTCEDRNDPFEKYINEIYKKELCISPINSLSVHLSNINSSYGLAPFINYTQIWEDNK